MSPKTRLSPTVSVHVLSHSMGCYVSLRILEPLRGLLAGLSESLGISTQFKLQQNMMVHPAIAEIDQGCSKMMLALAKSHGLKTVTSLAARGALRLMPHGWRTRVAIKALAGGHETPGEAPSKYNTHSVAVTAALLAQPRSVSNLLHLLHIEIKEITAFPDSLLKSAFSICTNRLVYSDDDKWATRRHKALVDKLILASAGDSETLLASEWLGENIPHQFCSNDAASGKLAGAIIKTVVGHALPVEGTEE